LVVVSTLRPRLFCASSAFQRLYAVRSVFSRTRQNAQPTIVRKCLERDDDPLFHEIAQRVQNNRPLKPIYSSLVEFQEKNPKESLIYEILMMLEFKDPEHISKLYEKAKDADATTTHLTNQLITSLTRHNKFDQAMEFLRRVTKRISVKSFNYLYKYAPEDVKILDEIRAFANNHGHAYTTDSSYLSALAKADFEAAKHFVLTTEELPNRAWNILFDASARTKDIDVVASLRRDYPKDTPMTMLDQTSLFMAVSKILPNEIFAQVKGEQVPNLSESATVLFKEFEDFLNENGQSPFQFPLVGFLYIPDWKKADSVIEYAESKLGNREEKLYRYYFETLEMNDELERASEYLKKIDSMGLAKDKYYSRLARGYFKLGQLENAKLVIEQMKEKDMEISYDLILKLSENGVDLE